MEGRDKGKNSYDKSSAMRGRGSPVESMIRGYRTLKFANSTCGKFTQRAGDRYTRLRSS